MASRPQGKSLSPTCILNGHSVHVEEAQAHIARISGELGVRAHVVVTRKGDDISSLAARALSENRHPVVAGGGDGTVSAVAGVLAGTDAAIGVLPMGTLNHFAKDVGIPRHLEVAVRNIFTGQVTNVDVGEVNGRVFVNNSGIGFYPHFVRQREEQEQHGHVKRVAFVLALRSVMNAAIFPPTDEAAHGPSRSVGTRDAVLVRRQQPLPNHWLGNRHAIQT